MNISDNDLSDNSNKQPRMNNLITLSARLTLITGSLNKLSNYMFDFQQ